MPVHEPGGKKETTTMSRWLARLAFSFILVAVVFAWEGYRLRRGDRGPAPEWKIYAYFGAAALCFVAGLRGVRERHRASDDRKYDES
jgi:hypothetical protein